MFRKRLFVLALIVLSLAAFPVAAETPLLEVHKSPACSCCGKWIEYMKSEGFEVKVVEADDLTPLKQTLGVPDDLQSCHTSTIGGYVIEGHVPAGDVRRLLAEKPAARGLAAGGMPPSAPGMDVPGRAEPYEVRLIENDGSSRVFSRH